jgi:hypothetical protein
VDLGSLGASGGPNISLTYQRVDYGLPFRVRQGTVEHNLATLLRLPHALGVVNRRFVCQTFVTLAEGSPTEESAL